jgi:hypothetical protein
VKRRMECPPSATSASTEPWKRVLEASLKAAYFWKISRFAVWSFFFSLAKVLGPDLVARATRLPRRSYPTSLNLVVVLKMRVMWSIIAVMETLKNGPAASIVALSNECTEAEGSTM